MQLVYDITGNGAVNRETNEQIQSSWASQMLMTRYRTEELRGSTQK